MKTLPFTPDLAPAVAEFNARLLAGGADPELMFPDDPVPEARPNEPCRLPEERFLMVQEGLVHGGFILRHQDFWMGGTVASIAHFRLPLSEGIVNRKFAGVGMQIVRHAIFMQPLLFALGMGGRQRALPRLLDGMNWKLWDVPFYFFVNRPLRFLRGIRVLRSHAWRSLALDIAAWSGLGWMVARMAQWVARRAAPEELTIENIQAFSNWADELWDECKPQYSFLAVRDSATLKLLYPEGSERFLCRRVGRSGKTVGWFIALDSIMQGHKQFGNLRVGSIADALARPEDAEAVIHAAAGFLRARGVDLIVSNQMHPAWGAALRSAGFLKAPSNFVLAVSPKLKEYCGDASGIHINRGDGDGPIHL
ncbi:MAG TPA: hypothetical protein VK687_02855 [Bryobacteraceae bacterium]|nr:hypothetical protein [Bryobacteraceae bacterium]